MKKALKSVFVLILIISLAVCGCFTAYATKKNRVSDWKKLYIDYVNSLHETYDKILIFYLDDDSIPELYISGNHHVAGSMICWIDQDEVKSQPFGSNFGYNEKSGKCYSMSSGMGVSLLTEYSLSNGKLSSTEIASCSENIGLYKWNGEVVGIEDYHNNVYNYTKRFLSPGLKPDYIDRSHFETTINNYSDPSDTIEKIQDGIHIYSDRTNMSTQVGDSITIGVGIFKNNTQISDISGISLSIEDSSVYGLKNTSSHNNCRYFSLKSKAVGQTGIIVSDSKTGYMKQFYLYAYNNGTCSYTIRNIPRYKIGEYTCNLNQGNSVFIDDFYIRSYNANTGEADISFTAYNSLGIYGAVEVYDKNATLKDVAVIKKFKSASTSIKECLWDKTLCLVDDIVSDKTFSYHSSVSYQKTSIKATIPKDGYIRITTDASVSLPVCLLNTSDMLMSGKSIAGELSGFIDREDEFIEKLSYNMVVNKLYEKLLETDSKIAGKIVKKVGKDALYSTEATGDYLESVLNNLQGVEIGKVLRETAGDLGWSISEDLFEMFSGPIGSIMKGLFTFSKIGNLSLQINDFICYQGTEYASVSNPASGAVFSSEVVVIDGNENKDIAIRSYKIEIGDDLHPSLIEMLQRRNQKVYDGEKTFFYEIKYIRNGELSEPETTVEVNIPVPDGLLPYIASKDVKVYRINDDQSVEEMRFTYKDGYVCFQTDHFSYYTMAVEKQDGIILGDADGDGVVSVLDAARIQKFKARLCNLDGSQYDGTVPSDSLKYSADTDGDNVISVLDATRIQKYKAHLCNLDGSQPYIA